VALLVTLLIVGLLSASVVSFIRLTHIEAKVADNMLAFSQAEIMARAGLRGAMAVLAMDERVYDSSDDEWGDFNKYAALGSGLFAEGAFTGRIEDLSGRFNPNYLVTDKGLIDIPRLEQFQRLLRSQEIDEERAEAVLDWVDKDSDPRPDGAERSYYSGQEDPYLPADGQFTAVSQLALVKGFTAEELYGKEEQPGLTAFLTVHSDGKINLNTASEAVLMSLDDGLTKSVAEAIISARTEKPFEKLDDLRDVSSLGPDVLARITSRSSVASNWYLIVVEGVYREARALAIAVVFRDKDGVRLIQYRVG
jgi:general secretion pathway protein K